MQTSSAGRRLRGPLGVYQTIARDNQSHVANDLLSHNHLPSHDHLLLYNRLRRLEAEMDIRDWSSRLKKKFKPGSKNRKPNRPGAESIGESVDSASSLVQPPPHVVTGSSRVQEEDRTKRGVQQVRSNDRLQPPDVEQEPVRGGDNSHEGEGVGVDGGEVSQRHSRPHSDVEGAAGSGPGREGNRADEENLGQGNPSPSTPSILHRGKPDSSM